MPDVLVCLPPAGFQKRKSHGDAAFGFLSQFLAWLASRFGFPGILVGARL